MSIRIEDGKGKGNLVEVTADNKLRTDSTSETKSAFEAIHNGTAYFWTATYGYSAGDTVLLIKNTDSALDLAIDQILIASSVGTRATVHFTDCDTPTGTAITGVNTNRKSGRTAKATAIQDETTNTQGDIIIDTYVAGSTSGVTIRLGGLAILGLNDCIGIDLATAGTCYITVIGYYPTVI